MLGLAQRVNKIVEDVIPKDVEEETLFDVLERVALHDIRKHLPRGYFLKTYSLSFDDRRGMNRDLYVHLAAYRHTEQIAPSPVSANRGNEYHLHRNGHKVPSEISVSVTIEEAMTLNAQFAATFERLEKEHKYHFSFVK